MTLIAKLREYGFNLNVLRLAPSYITKKTRDLKLILNIVLERRHCSEFLKDLS